MFFDASIAIKVNQKLISDDEINVDTKDVLKYKKEHNLAVFDEKREIELIRKNLDLLNDKELESYYLKFFQGVLESSKDYQRDHYE